jgi:protein ImuA
MAIAATAQAELSRLRQHIARLEGRCPEAERFCWHESAAGRPAAAQPSAPAGRRSSPKRRLALGIGALDQTIGGGLSLAALHEIRTRESRDAGAASGFALALASRLAAAGQAGIVLWVNAAESRRETGRLYAPGLAALGLDPARVVEVSVRGETDALWAFEAALSCRGLDVAICELGKASLDLSATRRCALRAREAGVTGLLLRVGGAAEATAAELRFRVLPAPAGRIGGFSAGIGRMAWQLLLEKNRAGRTGRFTVEWNADERCFAEPARTENAHPQPLPASAADRPPAQDGTDGLRRAS